MLGASLLWLTVKSHRQQHTQPSPEWRKQTVKILTCYLVECSLGTPLNTWFLLLCLPADTEHGQRLPDVEAAQQLKLRERQRFFEEVFQHDVDVYLSSAHLCIRDYKRRELDLESFYTFGYKIIRLHMTSQCFQHPAAPIGSISSMEVNVDLLDQMEPIDIPDQETLDVFFSSSGEEGGLTSPLPGIKAGSIVKRDTAARLD